MEIRKLVRESHRIAVEHGFDDATFGERIALVHSELSEALEAYRENGFNLWRTYDTTGYEGELPGDVDEAWLRAQGIGPGKPEGVASELADAVIRIADMCGQYNIDLEAIIREKQAYNETRSYRHGGKKL